MFGRTTGIHTGMFLRIHVDAFFTLQVQYCSYEYYYYVFDECVECCCTKKIIMSLKFENEYTGWIDVSFFQIENSLSNLATHC